MHCRHPQSWRKADRTQFSYHKVNYVNAKIEPGKQTNKLTKLTKLKHTNIVLIVLWNVLSRLSVVSFAFHSQKPLMVIHHLDDCLHSQGTHSSCSALSQMKNTVSVWTYRFAKPAVPLSQGWAWSPPEIVTPLGAFFNTCQAGLERKRLKLRSLIS